MTAADLVFEPEGSIDVLYAWNGRRWVRAGEVRWCSYWWCAFFLDENHYGEQIAKDGMRGAGYGREEMKRILMEHAVERIAEIEAFANKPAPVEPTRWNQIEIE